eukprot:scaffold16066_cov109-Cylindrotheca_fusiformis.AAC.6
MENRSKTMEEEVPVERTQKDVLCGRGVQVLHHVGNLRLHMAADEFREEYLRSRRSRKKEIAETIVKKLKASGSRFLRYSKQDKTKWVEATDAFAYSKVSHVLRGQNTGKVVRKMKEAEEFANNNSSTDTSGQNRPLLATDSTLQAKACSQDSQKGDSIPPTSAIVSASARIPPAMNNTFNASMYGMQVQNSLLPEQSKSPPVFAPQEPRHQVSNHGDFPGGGMIPQRRDPGSSLSSEFEMVRELLEQANGRANATSSLSALATALQRGENPFSLVSNLLSQQTAISNPIREQQQPIRQQQQQPIRQQQQQQQPNWFDELMASANSARNRSEVPHEINFLSYPIQQGQNYQQRQQQELRYPTGLVAHVQQDATHQTIPNNNNNVLTSILAQLLASTDSSQILAALLSKNNSREDTESRTLG